MHSPGWKSQLAGFVQIASIKASPGSIAKAEQRNYPEYHLPCFHGEKKSLPPLNKKANYTPASFLVKFFS
jgi:hypothetical protein